MEFGGHIGMVSDQSPMASKANYWSAFMGVKVPIFNGAEAACQETRSCGCFS